MQHKLLINGELVSGEGRNSLSIIRQRGTFYWRLPRHPQSRSMRCSCADAAFAEWGQTTPKARAELLLKLADVSKKMVSFLPNWSPVIVANRCIVRSMMKSGDCRCFRFFAGAARCLNGLAAGEYLEGHTSMIRRDPLGSWLRSHRGIIR
ncbi:aldehyde dehydrogenase family protein (plasmid) [Escherichia coli]|nr:aldehyde dehydrogenase family protein [Escherichia coli]